MKLDETELFHEIPDGQCILTKGGVAKQVPLFHRGEKLYAKANGGFVRLATEGRTSVPNLILDGLHGIDGNQLGTDTLGRYVWLPGLAEGKTKLRAV